MDDDFHRSGAKRDQCRQELDLRDVRLVVLPDRDHLPCVRDRGLGLALRPHPTRAGTIATGFQSLFMVRNAFFRGHRHRRDLFRHRRAHHPVLQRPGCAGRQGHGDPPCDGDHLPALGYLGLGHLFAGRHVAGVLLLSLRSAADHPIRALSIIRQPYLRLDRAYRGHCGRGCHRVRHRGIAASRRRWVSASRRTSGRRWVWWWRSLRSPPCRP